MKRWLIALLAILALAAPSTASATDANLNKWGISTRGADCLEISDRPAPAGSEMAYGAANDFTVRCAIDAAHNSPSYYRNAIQNMMVQGIRVLPIIIWKQNGQFHKPDPSKPVEVQYWRDFCGAVAGEFIYDSVITGWPNPHTYEIWNEPNNEASGGAQLSGVSDYHNNIYLPCAGAIWGQDINSSILWGALAFGCDTAAGRTPACTQDNNVDDAYWYAQWFQNTGQSGTASAVSVHPYGYTGSSEPFNRGDTLNQSVSRAQGEVGRVDLATTTNIVCTEAGRRTTDNSGNALSFNDGLSQSQFIDQLDNTSNGIASNCGLLLNWTGERADAVFETRSQYSSGLLTDGGGATAASQYWDNHAFTLVNSL